MRYIPRGRIGGAHSYKRPALIRRSVVRGIPMEDIEDKLARIEKEKERIEYNQELDERLEDLRDLYLEWVIGDNTLSDLLAEMVAHGLCSHLSPWK